MTRTAIGCAVVACMMIVAVSRAAETEAAAGLVARHTDGNATVVTLAATPNFSLKENESIHPQLTPKFTSTWEGVLKVVKRGTYTFAGGYKIEIDGKAYASPVDLDVGDRAIRLTFERGGGAARAQLTWESDAFPVEPVPASALGHRAAPAELAKSVEIDRGRLLVEEFNCVACHRAERSQSLKGRQAPNLTGVGSRLKADWIYHWLADPGQFRHGASMPRVPLKEDERRDVATYLATLTKPNDKVKEQPQPSRIPAGKALFETVGCKACHDKPGPSVDGMGSKWPTGQLTEYLLHPLDIDPSGRMPAMLTREEAHDLAEYLTQSRNPAFEAKMPEGGDAARGEKLVRSAGCLQCHVVETTKDKLLQPEPAMTVASLENLTAANGCLADTPPARATAYRLTADQRGAIVAFVDSIRAHPLITTAPVDEFRHKVATFRCTACHELNDFKPAAETERIPSLTNVGGKLRKEWINEVLTQKKRVRPWLKRRMPEFGPANVGSVAELAAATAGVGDAEALPVPTRDEIMAGQSLLGTAQGGLGCITCHGFNDVPPSVPEDTRGPDITSVASRLRPDHFRRWVLDPKRVSPSTPMPNFFEGAPPAEARAKVEAMFKYVAMGANMPPPAGFIDKSNYMLAVRDDPVVMRAFLPNLAGGPPFPRGIAVGLPGLINYCFDADTCTLRYAWTGGFLDMKPSWAARGGQVVRVQGIPFYKASLFPVRVGEQTKPTFMGYELATDGTPQMLYRVGPVNVRETVTALAKDVGIVRTFEFEGKGDVSLAFVDQANVTIATDVGAWIVEASNKVIKVPAGTNKVSVTFTLRQ